MKKDEKEYQISEDLINGYSPDGFYDGDNNSVDDTDKAVLQIYKTHGLIHAVRFYKEMSSENLSDSKKYVQDILIKNGIIDAKNKTSKNNIMDLEKLDKAGTNLQKSGKGVMKGCFGLVVLIIIGIVFFATMCTSSDKKENKKEDSITSMENEVASMQSKWKAKRLDDINMIIQKNIAMKDVADITTFKAYIINEYEAYFNMQYKYVETEIWNKAQKKFPNSFQDQDSYCSEHNCKVINYGDNSVELNIINDNEENHIDEINELVSRLYNN